MQCPSRYGKAEYNILLVISDVCCNKSHMLNTLINVACNFCVAEWTPPAVSGNPMIGVRSATLRAATNMHIYQH